MIFCCGQGAWEERMLVETRQLEQRPARQGHPRLGRLLGHGRQPRLAVVAPPAEIFHAATGWTTTTASRADSAADAARPRSPVQLREIRDRRRAAGRARPSRSRRALSPAPERRGASETPLTSRISLRRMAVANSDACADRQHEGARAAGHAFGIVAVEIAQRSATAGSGSAGR